MCWHLLIANLSCQVVAQLLISSILSDLDPSILRCVTLIIRSSRLKECMHECPKTNGQIMNPKSSPHAARHVTTNQNIMALSLHHLVDNFGDQSMWPQSRANKATNVIKNKDTIRKYNGRRGRRSL